MTAVSQNGVVLFPAFRQESGLIVAQHVNVVLVDDIDGSSATETVTFGLDGASYEIDLSEDNAARLRSSLTQFVENGRRAGGNRSKSTRAASRSSQS